jgi:hypothetical protein
MPDGASRDRKRIWFALIGATVGVALGILVSVTTDVPFAPEAGLLLGAVVGWFSASGLRPTPLAALRLYLCDAKPYID